MIRHLLIGFFYSLFAASGLQANLLRIQNLQVVDAMTLEVEISWENSWRTEELPPFNHDAIWVFGKYRTSGGQWMPLQLSSWPGDHTVSNPDLEAAPAPDGTGMMVRRISEGAGPVAPTLLQIRLASPLPPGSYGFRIMGIEMVYVPQGPFYAGDTQSAHGFHRADSLLPYWIQNPNTILVGNGPGSLSDTIKYPPAGNIPAAWPNGFEGFYAMKYEISQEQYVDFLNTLPYSQQLARTQQVPSSATGTRALAYSQSLDFRNGVTIRVPGIPASVPAEYACDLDGDFQFFDNEDAQSRACNFLSYPDLLAYLDWASLRPMTELEYEKAGRGPEFPVPGAFAWGTPFVRDANSLVADGTANETVTEAGDSITGVASHGYFGPQGPLRCGFNGSAISDRMDTGASFFGLMEFSGNLWEYCVNVSASGLLFSGSHGDGMLSPSGDANVPDWDAGGGGLRGGAWNSGITGAFRDLAISDRFYAGLPVDSRRNTTGGRGVRSW
jgi:formylglycine-generating enzyme required for sulfatase activity